MEGGDDSAYTGRRKNTPRSRFYTPSYPKKNKMLPALKGMVSENHLSMAMSAISRPDTMLARCPVKKRCFLTYCVFLTEKIRQNVVYDQATQKGVPTCFDLSSECFQYSDNYQTMFCSNSRSSPNNTAQEFVLKCSLDFTSE